MENKFRYYRVQPKGLDLPIEANTSNTGDDCNCERDLRVDPDIDRFDPDCPDCGGTGKKLPLKGKIFVFNTLAELRIARRDSWCNSITENAEIVVIESENGAEESEDYEGFLLPCEGARIVRRKAYPTAKAEAK